MWGGGDTRGNFFYLNINATPFCSSKLFLFGALNIALLIISVLTEVSVKYFCIKKYML